MSPSGSTNPLPEERLLKLIRAKPAATAAASAATSAAPITAKEARRPAWLPLLIGVLSIGLLVEVSLLVTQVLQPAPALPPPPATADDTTPHTAALRDPLEELPLLTDVASRPFFSAPVVTTPSTTSTPAGPKEPSESTQQLAGRLTLMGIMGGDPPQIIIEDAKTKKTYFVAPGQMVVEGAVVKEVLENRVILEVRGETFELAL